MSVWILVSYLTLGAVAGVISGLLGLGGGVVIVPCLLYLYHVQDLPDSVIMHLAVGSSLATVVFTSLVSTWAHHQHRAVQWPSVLALAPGILVGAALGSVIADFLPARGLRSAFGIFEILIGIQLAVGLKPSPHGAPMGRLPMFGAGSVIGSISTVMGIGGGSLTVPFLLWNNVGMRQAVASSAACGLPIALAGSIGFAAIGWKQADLPAWTTGYIYWPAALGVLAASMLSAPLGARLAHTLPVATLRRIFSALLIAVGIRMVL